MSNNLKYFVSTMCAYAKSIILSSDKTNKFKELIEKVTNKSGDFDLIMNNCEGRVVQNFSEKTVNFGNLAYYGPIRINFSLNTENSILTIVSVSEKRYGYLADSAYERRLAEKFCKLILTIDL